MAESSKFDIFSMCHRYSSQRHLTKGQIVVECGKLLEWNNYRIKLFNTIDFKKSMHYNTGTKDSLIDALAAMREYLEPGEEKLRDLTDSVLEKLEAISGEDFAALELFPDFDE